MDFLIKINENVYTFEQFEDLLTQIRGDIAQWNNFNSGQKLVIELVKTPSNSPTLGVVVDVKAIFGGK
jgi:hypothetical protein